MTTIGGAGAPVRPAGRPPVLEEQLEEKHQVPGRIDGVAGNHRPIPVSIGMHFYLLEVQGLMGDPVVASDSPRPG